MIYIIFILIILSPCELRVRGGVILEEATPIRMEKKLERTLH